MDQILGTAGLLVGVISFAYAVYTNREMKKLKAHQIDNLRSTLKDTIVVMVQTYRMMNQPEKYGISDPQAIKRISAAHSNSATIIRAIFRDLSKIDLPYDNDKLNGYVQAGLITSNWVWQQALTYAESPASFKRPELPNDTPDWFDE